MISFQRELPPELRKEKNNEEKREQRNGKRG